MTSDDAFIPNTSTTNAEKKRRFDTIDFKTTTTTNTASSSSSHLFKRGGAKATKYSELLEREKPDAKLPTREELRVKTTEQSKEQFDLLVSAWSRERRYYYRHNAEDSTRPSGRGAQPSRPASRGRAEPRRSDPGGPPAQRVPSHGRQGARGSQL